MIVKKFIKKYGFYAALVATIWISLYKLINIALPIPLSNDSLSAIALISLTFIYSIIIPLYLNTANNISKED